METKELLEIREKLAMLPVLKERQAKLKDRISASETEVKSLLNKFESESLDVEQMKAESLSVYILKLIGKHEGKLNKETEEMLAAKMAYDKAAENMKELKRQRSETEDRLAELNRVKQAYEEELNRREEMIRSQVSGEVSEKYRELEREHELLCRQLAETEEALRAANRVTGTARQALEQLEKADNWATYDVWMKGGIFSHMAKYEHIDQAEESFNRLNSQLDHLRRELSDVNLPGSVALTGIDSSTRTFDFWFDNIFTDLNVRNRIRDNSQQIRMLCGQINSIAGRLEGNIASIGQKLRDIELRKNELIIGG